MKTTILSAMLLYLSAGDAKKHRLCCCSGIDENAPGVWSEKRPTCLQAPSEQIVAASGGKFITNLRVWNFNLDKRVPFKDADSSHYWYAANTPLDDNWVGGSEAYDLCSAKGYGSSCFTPMIQDYRNPGTYKRSQNVNQAGEVVVVERDLDIMERDIVERKENATKPAKHHGAGWYKSHNSTSTKHHSKPTTTAPPTKMADLLERDLLEERKVNATKPKKHHSAGHHGNKTSTKTHHSKTKHHYKPSTTAPPTKIADLLERDVITERKVNVTTSTKSKKPKTTLLQVTKSAAHHYGNGTAATATWATASATASAGGVVYCNPYWKAPGCVDAVDPAATPVVCGQYWKAKGCVPATTGA